MNVQKGMIADYDGRQWIVMYYGPVKDGGLMALVRPVGDTGQASKRWIDPAKLTNVRVSDVSDETNESLRAEAEQEVTLPEPPDGRRYKYKTHNSLGKPLCPACGHNPRKPSKLLCGRCQRDGRGPKYVGDAPQIVRDLDSRLARDPD